MGKVHARRVCVHVCAGGGRCARVHSACVPGYRITYVQHLCVHSPRSKCAGVGAVCVHVTRSVRCVHECKSMCVLCPCVLQDPEVRTLFAGPYGFYTCRSRLSLASA